MTTYKEIRGTNIEVLASDPSNPVEGQVWFNSTDNVLKGQAATSAVGTIIIGEGIPLSGLAATAAVGAITPTEQTMGLTGVSATISVGNPGIQHYQDVATGSNTSYSNIATGSNSSYSSIATGSNTSYTDVNSE